MGRDCVLDDRTFGDFADCVNDSVRTWICVNVRSGCRNCETDDCEDDSEWTRKFECVHI